MHCACLYQLAYRWRFSNMMNLNGHKLVDMCFNNFQQFSLNKVIILPNKILVLSTNHEKLLQPISILVSPKTAIYVFLIKTRCGLNISKHFLLLKRQI